MTKQEIIDKINTGIRGQGSMVDIGGVLADVLEGIIGLSTRSGVLTIRLPEPFENKTREEVKEAFGITDDELDKLHSGLYASVTRFDYVESYLIVVSNDGDSIFFFNGDAHDFGATYSLRFSNSGYTFNEI